MGSASGSNVIGPPADCVRSERLPMPTTQCCAAVTQLTVAFGVLIVAFTRKVMLTCPDPSVVGVFLRVRSQTLVLCVEPTAAAHSGAPTVVNGPKPSAVIVIAWPSARSVLGLTVAVTAAAADPALTTDASNTTTIAPSAP